MPVQNEINLDGILQGSLNETCDEAAVTFCQIGVFLKLFSQNDVGKQLFLQDFIKAINRNRPRCNCGLFLRPSGVRMRAGRFIIRFFKGLFIFHKIPIFFFFRFRV